MPDDRLTRNGSRRSSRAFANDPDVLMSDQCVEELRAVREAAQAAATSAHEVSMQLKRIADMGEGFSATLRRWAPRVISAFVGAAAVMGASPEAVKFLERLTGH